MHQQCSGSHLTTLNVLLRLGTVAVITATVNRVYRRRRRHRRIVVRQKLRSRWHQVVLRT